MIGTVFSLNPYLQAIPAAAVVLSVLGAVGGGIAARQINRAVDSGFQVGMVRVIVNERASVIRKAMVTDQGGGLDSQVAAGVARPRLAVQVGAAILVAEAALWRLPPRGHRRQRKLSLAGERHMARQR